MDVDLALRDQLGTVPQQGLMIDAAESVKPPGSTNLLQQRSPLASPHASGSHSGRWVSEKRKGTPRARPVTPRSVRQDRTAWRRAMLAGQPENVRTKLGAESGSGRARRWCCCPMLSVTARSVLPIW